MSYGGRELFRDVSLALAPGSFHFLTGPSGAGKTTLIKLCYGELRASMGRVSVFGDDLGARAEEIAAITKALTKRAKKEDQVFVFLGDMNIPSREDEVWQALVDSDMEVPFFEPTNMKGDKFYDQIAYTVKGAATRKTRLIRNGVFDWRNAVFGPSQERDPDAPDDPEFVSRISDAEHIAHYEPINAAMRIAYGKTPYANFASQYATNFMTFEMSDHLPIWVELEVDYSDAYLARFLNEE